MTKQTALRALPSVDGLLSEPALKDLAGSIPRSLVLQAARETLDSLRASIRAGEMPAQMDVSSSAIAEHVLARALALASPSLRHVINATGVILHTGLGRAVLPEQARQVLNEVASGHSNLEIERETGTRASRSEHYRKVLADLCGAESGFAVNNNAAAVFLALNTLASGREVIVSRGELVEIGGSFRMPDIMVRAGARLVEVGTTNRTRISDYEKAVTEETAVILRVHTSNFRVVGFTESPVLSELVGLGRKHRIPVMDDVGSGALLDMTQFGLKGEPLVQDSVRAGTDIVTFSGDKLLGGPQAGLIVGRMDLLEAMAKNPLARVLRLGKLTIGPLESTLRLYSDPEAVIQKIPTLRYIARPVADIARQAEHLRRALHSLLGDAACVETADGFSEVGGGSLPGEQLPTKLLAIASPRISPLDLAELFRKADPPVFGRVGDDRFLLDLRTVEESGGKAIKEAALRILRD